jgi:hypothetical protein
VGSSAHHARDHRTARQRDTLPLAAGEIGSAFIAAGKYGVELARSAAPASAEPLGSRIGRAGRSYIVAQRQFEANEIWNTAVTRAPGIKSSERKSIPSISIAPLCGSYKRHNNFASVVLPAPFWPTMAATLRLEWSSRNP